MTRTITIKITEEEATAIIAIYGYVDAGGYADQFGCEGQKEYEEAVKEVDALKRVVDKIKISTM